MRSREGDRRLWYICSAPQDASMKTTFEISDSLLGEARELTSREGISLGSLIEEGLRRMIAEDRSRPAFRMRKASFKGQGLQSDFREAGSESVRAYSYGRRGG
jgi:hypothetical protein